MPPVEQVGNGLQPRNSPCDSEESCLHFENHRSRNRDRAGSRVIKMLHCVVRSFNQLNIYYYKNTKTMVVLWCHMHMLLSHSSDECLTLLLLL